MAESENKRDQTPQADPGQAPPKKKHSYDSVCGKCGALLPAGKDACLICHTPRDEIPFQGHFPVESHREVIPHPVRERDGTDRKTPDLWRRWAGALTGVVLLLFVSVAGFGLYLEYFDTSSHRALESVIYQVDGQYLLTNPGLESPRPIEGIAAGGEITDVRSSPNGRWMACNDAAGTLYLLDLAQRMLDGDVITAQPVATELAEPPVFSKNSRHLIFRNRRDELFASDFSESWQLDTGVMEISAVDENQVLYTRRGDQPGQVDLYWEMIAQYSGQRNVIDRNVVEVVDYSDGFGRILYTGMRPDEEGEEQLYLQLFELGQGTTVTLEVGVDRLLDASAERGTAYYLKAAELSWDYGTFVNDDYERRDAILSEPLLEDYPLVEEAMEQYGAVEEFLDIEDNDDLLEELAQYTEAMDRWEDKLHRDSLRKTYTEAIAQSKGEILMGDLYAYANGETTLVDTGVVIRRDTGSVSASRGYVTYEKVYPASLTKITLSQQTRDTAPMAFSPVQYFYDEVSRQLMFCALGGTPDTLFAHTSSSSYLQWLVSPGGEGVYFLVSAATSSDLGAALYWAPVRNGVPGEASLVQRGVENLLLPFGDGIVYEDVHQGQTRLCTEQQGRVTVLSGTSRELEQSGENALFYFGAGGDLYLFAREEQLVGTQVVEYAHMGNQLVYYLRPGAGGDHNELYVWNSGREHLQDMEASALLWDSSR